jgi:hypothetical protein
MPVDNSVESLLAPADPRFSTPVKPVRQSNGENGETAPADSSSDSDSNAESGKQPNADGDNQPKRPWNGRANYRLVQSWDIGKNRTQDYEVSKQELYLMARNSLRTAGLSSCRRTNLSQPIFICGNNIAATQVPNPTPLFAFLGVP